MTSSETVTENEVKYCKSCSRTLPVERFCSDQTTQDGRSFYCRICCAGRRKTASYRASAERSRKRPGQKYQLLKDRIQKRGEPVLITLQQYVELIAKPCMYCGGPLPTRGVGLDRLVTTKGD